MKAFYKTLLLFLATLLTACIACACTKDKKGYFDYYGEYSLELPFAHERTSFTDVLYFTTELDIEGMAKALSEEGYTANIYDFDGVKRIWVTATKEEDSHYFLIYDKTCPVGDGEKYVLCDLSASIREKTGDNSYDTYVFLFPEYASEVLQFSDGVIEPTILSTRKIYCDFEEFAAFYKGTGKEDATIDKENKTVTFPCKVSDDKEVNPNWKEGKVLMRYVEKADASYVEIELFD